MKILYLKSLRLSLCVAGAFLSSFSVLAQSESNSFPSYGDEGLRTVDINEIIDKTYLRDSTLSFIAVEATADEWLITEKTIYEYNIQGREELREIFAREANAWVGYKKKISSYLSDFLVAEEELVKAENKTTYKSKLKREFSYNYIGLLSEITTFD